VNFHRFLRAERLSAWASCLSLRFERLSLATARHPWPFRRDSGRFHLTAGCFSAAAVPWPSCSG